MRGAVPLVQYTCTLQHGPAQDMLCTFFPALGTPCVKQSPTVDIAAIHPRCKAIYTIAVLYRAVYCITGQLHGYSTELVRNEMLPKSVRVQIRGKDFCFRKPLSCKTKQGCYATNKTVVH